MQLGGVDVAADEHVLGKLADLLPRVKDADVQGVAADILGMLGLRPGRLGHQLLGGLRQVEFKVALVAGQRHVNLFRPPQGKVAVAAGYA